MKRFLIDNVKNFRGAITNRKFVAFAVDDYGNIRTHSNKALFNMEAKGVKPSSRFDVLDHLETKHDLEALYETLQSVKDKNGRHAVFTPLAMSGNINFEEIEHNKYTSYAYEKVTQSFTKLASILPAEYDGAWKLWKEGIVQELMQPQFHGREHLNLKAFETKLNQQDLKLMVALQNRSFACISDSGFPNISPTAAFEFESIDENMSFEAIVKQGLEDFKEVYGYSAKVFNAPGGRENPAMHQYLKANGIEYIETPWFKNEHLGNGSYRKVVNHTGKKNHLGMPYSVRNVVFEPTDDRGFDWVSLALRQVNSAFRWKKPAIISSHRVNFCGMLSEENRKVGIGKLKQLLYEVVKQHPDVEFVGLAELCNHLFKKENV